MAKVHPIDDAYKRTAEEIGQRLSKIKAEVGEIERLATTKTAILYGNQIKSLQVSAITMGAQLNELKSLIDEDCGAVGGGTPSPSKQEQQPETISDLKNAMRNQFRAT